MAQKSTNTLTTRSDQRRKVTIMSTVVIATTPKDTPLTRLLNMKVILVRYFQRQSLRNFQPIERHQRYAKQISEPSFLQETSKKKNKQYKRRPFHQY